MGSRECKFTKINVTEIVLSCFLNKRNTGLCHKSQDMDIDLLLRFYVISLETTPVHISELALREIVLGRLPCHLSIQVHDKENKEREETRNPYLATKSHRSAVVMSPVFVSSSHSRNIQTEGDEQGVSLHTTYLNFSLLPKYRVNELLTSKSRGN